MKQKNLNEPMLLTIWKYYQSGCMYSSFYEIFMNFIKFNSVIFIIRLFSYPLSHQKEHLQDLKLELLNIYLLHNLPGNRKMCQGSFRYSLDNVPVTNPMLIDQPWTKLQ